jgi:hypothetical protein
MDLIKIDGLPAIAETIEKLLSTTTGTISLIVFLFLFLIIKLPQIPLIQSFNERKSKRLKLLQDHASSSTDELFCKSIVEDIRNAIIFEQATRIYAEKNWRKGLAELHGKTGVSWVVMKRAHRFMEIRLDGTVYVRDFTWTDKFDYVFNLIMTWTFLVLAAVVFIVGFIYKPSPLSIFYSAILGVILFGFAITAAFQNVPRSSAIILKNRLTELKLLEDPSSATLSN